MDALRVSIPRDIELLVKEYETVNAENARLRNELNELEESHKMLSSVSLIVAANKEIHKLNTEVAILKRRVVHYQNLCKTDTVVLEEDDTAKGSIIMRTPYEETQLTTLETELVEDNANRMVASEDEDHATESMVAKNSDDDDDEIEVVEQVIQGETYFVSDDKHKIIYKRVFEDDDYDIGDEIGFIGKDGIPVWS